MPDTLGPLHLRRFRLSDATAIEPWLAGPGLSLPGGAARREWPRRLLADARIVALVGVVGRQRVGLVRLDCGPDGVGEVTLVVAPEHRRRGQGRALFQAALGEARRLGLRRLVALIDLSNSAAFGFFSEQGFERDGLVGDRIRMVRVVHARLGAPWLDVHS